MLQIKKNHIIIKSLLCGLVLLTSSSIGFTYNANAEDENADFTSLARVLHVNSHNNIHKRFYGNYFKTYGMNSYVDGHSVSLSNAVKMAKYLKYHHKHTRKIHYNTHNYKNREVKNLAISLDRLDEKLTHLHGHKKSNLIKRIKHVNGQLGRLVGKHGSKSTHDYKNYEIKNVAVTLNRIDNKAHHIHGKKYYKLIKNLKHCNYTLIKLA